MYKALLTPVFTKKKERKEFINSLEKKFPTFQEWQDFISSHHQTMMELAKWYIYTNWKKVKDWGEYEIEMDNITYRNTPYTSDSNSKQWNELVLSLEDRRRDINWIDVVYDYTDGDLSIAINDKDNWEFLDEEQIMELCLYIEQQLNK